MNNLLRFIRKTSTAASFPGAPTSQYTSKLDFVLTKEVIPTFRVLTKDGVALSATSLEDDTMVKMYKSILTLNTIDNVMYDAQRQGRISFYMTSYGEEAIHFGSAPALKSADQIFGQYRESGVLLWRGFQISEFMDQMYSNERDMGKGRQMPIHYGSKKLGFQTISSPLGTQIPQAVGAAYALKLENIDAVTMCYFGDGAASEGDFHAALNMASTTESPVIFFCRNNGYAISTPVREQYRGDGIASRGSGYGIPTIRVDGNDVLAVYEATKEARRIARERGPVLIEAMTYRVGHHSTSDDSSAYRSKEEVKDWTSMDSPITRFRLFLEGKSLWSEDQEVAWKRETRTEILKEFGLAEKRKKAGLSDMFTDVYEKKEKHLVEQENEMLALIKDYPEHFDLSIHSSTVRPE